MKQTHKNYRENNQAMFSGIVKQPRWPTLLLLLILHSIPWHKLGFFHTSRLDLTSNKFIKIIRSCQNKLMGSNNFDVNVAVKKCNEVESLPKTIMAVNEFYKFFCVVNRHENSNFWNL